MLGIGLLGRELDVTIAENRKGNFFMLNCHI